MCHPLAWLRFQCWGFCGFMTSSQPWKGNIRGIFPHCPMVMQSALKWVEFLLGWLFFNATISTAGWENWTHLIIYPKPHFSLLMIGKVDEEKEMGGESTQVPPPLSFKAFPFCPLHTFYLRYFPVLFATQLLKEYCTVLLISLNLVFCFCIPLMLL